MNGEFRLGLGSGFDARACGIDSGRLRERLGGGSEVGVLCEGRGKHQKCVGIAKSASDWYE